MPIDYTNSANQVRARVSDPLRFEQDTFIGDGSASAFKLRQGAPASTVTAASAFIFGTTGYSGTGATFDNDLGRVSFAGTISANSAVQVSYSWSLFSDERLNYYLYSAPNGGSISNVALLCIKELQFDGLKRASWAAPDGTSYDDTAALNQLKAMYDEIWAELREEPSGGIESWSEQQANYFGPYSG